MEGSNLWTTRGHWHYANKTHRKVLLHRLFLIFFLFFNFLAKTLFYVFKCCWSSAVVIVFAFLSFSLNVAPIAVIVSVGNVLHHRDLHHHRYHRHQSSSPPIIITTSHHHHHHGEDRARVKPFLPRLVCCRLSFTLLPPTMPPSPSPRETRFCLIILNLFPDTRRGRSTRTSAMCASVSTRTQSSPSTTRPRSISIKVNWTPSN